MLVAMLALTMSLAMMGAALVILHNEAVMLRSRSLSN